MKKTTRLRQLINAPEILIMPGVYDCLSARIAEMVGFAAIQVTGFGLSAACLGAPDYGLLTMTEMLEQTRRIVRAVAIPVMADGDTGFGNPLNIHRMVQELEDMGAAGVNIEDQVFPKRCGHMTGKQVVPLEEAVARIRAAVHARRDPDFIINARTDAIAVLGVEEAVRRGNAYAGAGADLIFVEAPRSVEEIAYVVKNIKAPVSINMLEDGRTPLIGAAELEKMGVARVSAPLTPLFAAARAMEEALRILKEKGTTAFNRELFTTFPHFSEITGLERYRELESALLTDLEIKLRYGSNEALLRAKEENR
ncbi:carboxyvinyl-carboxyphosphonate phosphorylmutase [Desulfofundulus thermobenzoicus]|uniref:Carboxyvinyl-carboxyphosphonate phosphorylmutase n=1 Tax=Desulfofundulus thermobenzoicus TaxID=29376 RepID=A0A6N7IUA1_9FIRM|nr:isocitrate lyase/PEP mutase family protein [Desulfofundulus thermobenzoicus]MQL53133.1 carboxyvinyl-carboxyphosphonate phosphorylmutase [Desulfofundulus thermobenzoicus]HHW43449.1 isocitrate lyase/PEP mutase family protein [Desulfotomaculum sp.]